MFKINLAKRERYVVFTAACLIGIFLLTNFLILPFFKEKDRLQKGIALKQEEFKQISDLSLEYQKYQKGSGDVSKVLARRDKGFSLTSYLEEAARKAGVSLKGMTQSQAKDSGAYKEATVELKLEGVNTEQLVNYLYYVENPESLIFVRRISVSDNKKQEGYLDCIIQVLTYQ